jgi:hypothetical protein
LVLMFWFTRSRRDFRPSFILVLMSSRTSIVLSKTFFSRCMQSTAWGVSSSFQYDRYLKKHDYLKGMAGVTCFASSSPF